MSNKIIAIFRIVAILLICVFLFSSCSNERYIIKNITYMELDFLREQSKCETKLIGTVETRTLYGLDITAIYDETIYCPLGDITKRKYKVTGAERDGVSVNVTEDDYICFDLKGNVIAVSLEHIMDTEIKAYEPNDSENGLGFTCFDKSEDEIRATVEELLGNIVDWSLFNDFDLECRSPTLPIWIDEAAVNYTYAFLEWSQYASSGKQICRTFRCVLEFASWDEESGVRSFYDNAHIRSFSIFDPFGDIKDFTKYIERIPKYGKTIQAFKEYHSDLVSEKSGCQIDYKDASNNYSNGRITVYNGKVCYYVWVNVYIPDDAQTIYMITIIIPLE